jgi:hypothetical protein
MKKLFKALARQIYSTEKFPYEEKSREGDIRRADIKVSRLLHIFQSVSGTTEQNNTMALGSIKNTGTIKQIGIHVRPLKAEKLAKEWCKSGRLP